MLQFIHSTYVVFHCMIISWFIQRLYSFWQVAEKRKSREYHNFSSKEKEMEGAGKI